MHMQARMLSVRVYESVGVSALVARRGAARGGAGRPTLGPNHVNNNSALARQWDVSITLTSFELQLPCRVSPPGKQQMI